VFDLNKLLAVVSTVAKAVVPGAAEGLAAGEALLDLVKDVRATLASDDQALLDAALEPLLIKMNRDVDAALLALR
jgi:hypothetical protein